MSKLIERIDETREKWVEELNKCRLRLIDPPLTIPDIPYRMVLELDYLLVEAKLSLKEWRSKFNAMQSSWTGTSQRALRYKLENATLLEALQGFLELHAAFMADAGFNPPVCECELCVNAREAHSKAKETQ